MFQLKNEFVVISRNDRTHDVDIKGGRTAIVAATATLTVQIAIAKTAKRRKVSLIFVLIFTDRSNFPVLVADFCHAANFIGVQVAIGNMAQQSSFPYVAQLNFSDPSSNPDDLRVRILSFSWVN